MQRATITKESQKKKRWRKAQQGEARKEAKRRKPTEPKEATQRREEEHRGKRRSLTKENKGQAKAPDPGPQLEVTETNSESNPSIEIKGECKTHLTQRVTPSRRNTNETKRLSLRSDRVEETNPDTRPSQGDPIAKAVRNTTDGDRRRTKRRQGKKTEPRQRRGKLDRR